MGKLVNFTKEKFPKFLIVLVLTEVWERYSYFTIRAIGVLFMTSILKLDDARALRTHALVSSIGNLLPLLTGFLADRFFGFRAMTLAGGFVIAVAHFLFALSYFNDLIYFWGLATISLGIGIFRGNISNLLGACYDTHSSLDRIGGFTLFYAGVNLGAFVSYGTAGYLSESIGYHFTYSLAGFGMLIGLFIFTKNRNIYLKMDFSGKQNILKTKVGPFGIPSLIFIAVLILTFPTTVLFYYADIIGKINLALWIGILTAVLLVYVFFSIKSKKERYSYILLVIYLSYLLIFEVFDGQVINTVVLYIDRNVYQYWGPIYLPASFVTTINPAVIMVSGFLLSSFYKHSVKFELPRIAFALITVFIGLGILYLGLINADSETSLTSYLYPAMTTFVMACGEVSIAPLMQAVATIHAPQSKRGLTMGMYMSIQGIASLLLVVFSFLFDVPEDEQGNYDPKDSLQTYLNAFLTMFYMSLGCFCYFVLSFFLIFLLRKKIASAENNENKAIKKLGISNNQQDISNNQVYA